MTESSAVACLGSHDRRECSQYPHDLSEFDAGEEEGPLVEEEGPAEGDWGPKRLEVIQMWAGSAAPSVDTLEGSSLGGPGLGTLNGPLSPVRARMCYELHFKVS